MLMLKVQYNILNYTQSEGSRFSYVKILNYMQFRTYCRKSLWIFSCEVCTDPDVHILFRAIWTYPRIFSNVNIFMIGWNNVYSTSEAWKLQQWFRLIFLYVFKLQTYKPCRVFICLCTICICCYRRKIITTVFRSKYELVRYLLDLVLDRSDKLLCYKLFIQYCIDKTS